MSNPKLDLHNINAHTNFDENPFRFTEVIGDSSQLTPLSTICKQPGPAIWFPLFLSLASLLSIASFVLRNLI